MVTARSEDQRHDQWVRSTAREAAGALPAGELVEVVNGFVRLAAERYRRAGLIGEAIRVYLHSDDRQPILHIADYGPGMAGADLHRLARRLQSEVSTLALPIAREAAPHFGVVAQECEVISLTSVGQIPWRLTMTQGFSHYTARADPSALRVLEGTDVYLRGVDPRLLRGVTVARMAEALQRGNHGGLLEGAYTLQVCGAGEATWVTTFRAGGVPLMLPPLSTPWGPVHLAVSAHETTQLPPAPIILRGERDLLVLGDLTAIAELNSPPWTSGRLSGEVRYPCLRRNPLQTHVPGHRQRLAALVEALQGVEGQIQRDLDEQEQLAAPPPPPPQPKVVEVVVPQESPEEPRGAWSALRGRLGRLLGRKRQ